MMGCPNDRNGFCSLISNESSVEICSEEHCIHYFQYHPELVKDKNIGYVIPVQSVIELVSHLIEYYTREELDRTKIGIIFDDNGIPKIDFRHFHKDYMHLNK